MTKPPRYNIGLVRSAASSRWPEILSHVCAVDVDYLDGQHHPCPKPGCGAKNDGFRYFADGTGGAICNQCFRSQNGDGFAFVQWMDGNRDFLAAVAKVAEYIGITPEPDSPASGKSGKSSKAKTGKHKQAKPKGKKNEQTGEFEVADPVAQLEFQPWVDAVVSLLWLPTKPPITLTALKRCHARLALYRQPKGQYQVIALPVWGEQLMEAEPVGWCLYNLSGLMLPRYERDAKTGEFKLVEEVKVKLTYGSQAGLIGPVELLANPATTHVWKVEGPSDLLAWWSLQNIAAGHVAITNANGAGEKPQSWMVKLLRGQGGENRKQPYVLHDADKPGQNGAVGWQDERGSRHYGWAEYLGTGV